MFKVKIERKIPKPVIGMKVKCGASFYVINDLRDGHIFCNEVGRKPDIEYGLCSIEDWNSNVLNDIIHIL